MRNLTAELALDGHARKKTSKTFNVRLTVDYRTATLRPFQDEGLAFLEAVYLNAPRRRREGSVLGGIGRKFMQQQREALTWRPAIVVSGPLTAIRDFSFSIRDS
jgi:hypothetical protein